MLIESPALCKIIAEKMHQDWSPEQIAGWLKRCYPDNQERHVSHETFSGHPLALKTME